MSVNAYLDVGNSRIKLAAGGKPGPDLVVKSIAWPQDSQGDCLASEHAAEQLQAELKTALAELSKRKIKRFFLASVVESERYALLIDALTLLAPQAEQIPVAVKKRCCRVRIDYDPSALGVDRFCALVEAYARCEHQACIIINCGTAITIDAIDAQGRHQGGLILPGVRAALNGLLTAAPGLTTTLADLREQPLRYPNSEFKHSALGLPQQTDAGCAAGLRLLFAAGIEQAARGLLAASSQSPHLILSGGDAEQIAELLDPTLEVQIEPNLVVSGVLRLSRARRS